MIWISREKNPDTWQGRPEFIDLWKKPPIPKNGNYEYDDACIVLCSIMLSEFKKTFGFTPRKGTCQQYQITLNRNNK